MWGRALPSSCQLQGCSRQPTGQCRPSQLEVHRHGAQSLPLRATAQSEQGLQGRSCTEEPSVSGRVELSPEKPQPSGLRLQKVERLGTESWAGVAAVDRGDASVLWRAKALLYTGDSLALLTFAAIGQLSHKHDVSLFATLGTAAPFLLGWLGAAQLTHAAAPVSGARAAAWQATKCWALAIPVGLAIRSAVKGHLPEPSFAGVTLAFTFITLVGWRSALAALTPDQGGSDGKDSRVRGNRRGGPLEFLQLLTSLVKRW